MTRDVAFAIFDDLTLRGFAPSLSVFHGVMDESSAHRTRSVHRPIYSVQVGGKVESCCLDQNELRHLLELADEHNVHVTVEPNGYARITERS